MMNNFRFWIYKTPYQFFNDKTMFGYIITSISIGMARF